MSRAQAKRKVECLSVLDYPHSQVDVVTHQWINRDTPLIVGVGLMVVGIVHGCR